MKLKEGYELIDIMCESLVVPIADKMTGIDGILRLSESGVFLWKQLKDEVSVEDLVSLLCAEYNADKNTAEVDVKSFIASLSSLGLLFE